MDSLKLWTQNAVSAIKDGAPLRVITAWLNGGLDGGLTPEPALFKAAALAQRVDVLNLLFDAAKTMGPEAVEAGAIAALSAPAATETSVLDNETCAVTVLAHTTPAMLNRSASTLHGGRDVPFWWHAYRNAAVAQDLHALLVLLREHGADLAATPFNGEGGGKHGDALRSLLLAERIELERAVLRQAATAAMAASEPAVQQRGRRRL